jgi:Zn-dependent protease with chaperone function
VFADSVAPNREDSTPARHELALGVVIAATVGGLVVGGVSAKLLHDARPEFAVFLASVLGLALYAMIRKVAHATANLSLRVSIASGAVCFVMAYFVVLAGETYRLALTPDHLDRLGRGMILLARMVGAASVAILIVIVAVWRDVGRQHAATFSGLAQLIIPVGMAAAGFVISMSAFMAVVALVPRPASLYLLVLMTFVLPLALTLSWTYVHVQLVSNWEVSVVPEPLTAALAELQRRCRFRFDRVICLDARYGGGRVGAVSSSARTATLFVSQPLTEMLNRDELLAVLAHETGHVELHHTRRKLLFGLLATATVLTAGFGVMVGLKLFMPHSLEVVAIILSGGVVGVGRQSYDTFVTRRHEREADEYAARAVSAAALLSALEKLGAGGRAVTMANRWTTHSTWEVRSERLRQKAIAATEDTAKSRT